MSHKRSVLVNVKMTQEEYKNLRKIADSISAGNVSNWIRERSLKNTPETSNLLDQHLNSMKDENRESQG